MLVGMKINYQVIEGKIYKRVDYSNRLATLEEVGKRYLPRSGRLKRALLKEYEWKCQECGKESKLEAHHIEPVKYLRNRGYSYQDGKGNHNLSNGRLLCRDCHRKIHIDRRDRNKAQII